MSAPSVFYNTPVPPQSGAPGTLVFASQRRAIRRAAHFGCQIVRERDFKLVADEVLDVSPDGMLVYCDDRVLTGDEMIVTFRLPRTSLWVDTDATVARVLHGRRPTDRGRCLGLEFNSLDARARRALRATLRSLPPPIPSRERRVDYAASVHLAALA